MTEPKTLDEAIEIVMQGVRRGVVAFTQHMACGETCPTDWECGEKSKCLKPERLALTCTRRRGRGLLR